jgi:hypothetical protein
MRASGGTHEEGVEKVDAEVGAGFGGRAASIGESSATLHGQCQRRENQRRDEERGGGGAQDVRGVR